MGSLENVNKLTKQQVALLDICACDSEIFFFLYASVNLDMNNDFVDENKRINAESIIDDIVFLVNNEYLRCWKGDKLLTDNIEAKEFEIYKNYRITTFKEHIVKFNYGPHEFKTTEKGISQITHEYSVLRGITS